MHIQQKMEARSTFSSLNFLKEKNYAWDKSFSSEIKIIFPRVIETEYILGLKLFASAGFI